MKLKLPAFGAVTALVVAGAVVAATGSPAVPVAPSSEVSTHGAEIGTAPVTWTAADYDGVALTADAPDLNDLPKVHGVYIHASDQPSNFVEFAAAFQAEQRRASQFMTNATGMAFRWDERQSADGRLLHDITVVKSKANLSRLSGSSQFSLVGDALKQAGLTDPNKKYYVWLDADSAYCGQGQGLYDAARSFDNAANGTSYSVSYRIGSPYEAIGGWCNPVLHELMHNMGAVASHMPNYYGGGHCDDDANDVMCQIDVSPGGAIDRERSRTLDGGRDGVGNDDYLDPAADLADTTGATLSWWTVNLSRFLCPRSATDPSVPDCSVANLPFGPEPTAEPTTSPSKGGGNKK